MPEQRGTAPGKMTMEDRIQAFYRQSGGPNNPKIRSFLQDHLLYGKDHGPPGHRENVEDAFIHMIVEDSSNTLLFRRLQHWLSRRKEHASDGTAAGIDAIRCEVANLRAEVERLRRLLEQRANRPEDH